MKRAAKWGIGVWASCLGVLGLAQAQVPDYEQVIRPIIRQHCQPCHRQEGTAPFPLETYAQLVSRTDMLAYVVETDYMPPWPANRAYRHFANERGLSSEEKKQLLTWLRAGAPKSKKSAQVRVKNRPAVLPQRAPDLVLRMPRPFVQPGDNHQRYVCYRIPLPEGEGFWAEAIEYRPGNRRIAHHASYQLLEVAPQVSTRQGPDYFIYSDSARVNDAHDYAFFSLTDATGGYPRETFHYGWLPGTQKQEFPSGSGFWVPGYGVLMLRNLHYSASPVEESDQAEIRIWKAQKPVTRPLVFAVFKPRLKQEADLIIPADSLKTYHLHVKLTEPIDLVAINPHMHLLGQYFKAYALLPGSGDTIPLIEIPRWDFNWQEFYRFPQPLRLPAGTVIKALARYDNTRNNSENPNSPPKDVPFERSMNDDDEMMRLGLVALPAK